MDKTKEVNRLYLGAVFWILASSIGVAVLPVFRNMTAGQMLVLSQFLYLLPVLIFLIVKKVNPKKWMPFQPLRISVLARIVLYTALLMPLVTLLNMISMLFVDNAVASVQEGLTTNTIWENLLVLAVIPAVCEEFTYRGIYYKAYRQRGVWHAILGSALVFGLMHMNFNQFFYAFALGIAFGLLLEATGSIFATMTAHFVVNGWSVVVMELSKSVVESAAPSEAAELTADALIAAFGIFGVFAAAGVCLAGLVLIRIAKKCGRWEHLKWCFRYRRRRQGTPRTILTPPFIIAAGIIVSYMIIIAA